jgi:hypothetical protein
MRGIFCTLVMVVMTISDRSNKNKLLSKLQKYYTNIWKGVKEFFLQMPQTVYTCIVPKPQKQLDSKQQQNVLRANIFEISKFRERDKYSINICFFHKYSQNIHSQSIHKYSISIHYFMSARLNKRGCYSMMPSTPWKLSFFSLSLNLLISNLPTKSCVRIHTYIHILHEADQGRLWAYKWHFKQPLLVHTSLMNFPLT